MPTGIDGAFSAGDLMMVSVLFRIRASGFLDEFPKLADYVARGEARPAYERTFVAHGRSTPGIRKLADAAICWVAVGPGVGAGGHLTARPTVC
jgi:hypothetical protein